MRHTLEARLAQQGSITYREAARRIFDRRESFATANPASVAVLGYASSILYRDGALCYLQDRHIRILDIHGSAANEQVISLPDLISLEFGGSANGKGGIFTLINYSDGFLICLYDVVKPDPKSYLLAIRIINGSRQPAKCVAIIPVESTTRIFARNNADYAFYGTHSETGMHGHHEWVISGFSLVTGEAVDGRVHLENFVGSEIGLTVCFEIHDQYFYALSNQTSFNVEEVDWTSNYHCYRFPLAYPHQAHLEIHHDIWRRNHAEGPINDSWTDMRLHEDECTGELMIVESRREWEGGGSTSRRTYYMQPLSFRVPPGTAETPVPTGWTTPSQSESSFANLEPSNVITAPHALLPDDPITLILTDGDKPTFTPLKPRLPRHVHPGDDGTAASSPAFILAKSKLRYYNPSCRAFLDLVDDPEDPPRGGGFRLQQRLRLRIGSRVLLPPARENGLLVRAELDEETGTPRPGSEEKYVARPGGIRMWPLSRPPPSLPTDPELEVLHSILNPPPSVEGGDVDGIADERSLVYLTGPAGATRRAIVLVNFDAAIKVPALPSLRNKAAGQTAMIDEQRMLRLGPQRDCRSKARGKQRSRQASVSPSAAGKNGEGWASEEPATYLGLEMGVWLR